MTHPSLAASVESLRSSAAPKIWVLNLDAEYEFELGKRYTPSRALERLVARQQMGLSLGPRDLVLDTRSQLSPAKRAELERLRESGAEAALWSPTPRALATLDQFGLARPEVPDFEILQRVNARPFATEVRRSLETADQSFAKQTVCDLDTALAWLAQPATLGWLVRRQYGAAGRGRRRIRAGQPSDHERHWLTASLRRGPLTIEPWVEITVEYTRSGFVDPNGKVTLSDACFQATNDHGAWLRTQVSQRGEVQTQDEQALEQAALQAGQALAQAGYFGPYGIDAYRHRTATSSGPREALNPMSEINARLTMDWLQAMGGAH